MAGRLPSLRSLVRALAKLKPAQIRQLLVKAKPPANAGRIARLQRKRERYLEGVRELDRQIAQLSGGNGAAAAPARRGRKPDRKKGYTLSAATRRKMSEAAKRRYAGKSAGNPAPEKKRRTISPETRAKLAEAAKQRWAARKQRSRFSAETRQKMAEAQRRRWEKVKGNSEPAPEVKPKTQRRALSPESRAKMAAAAKARWAKVKSNQASS